MKTNYRPLFLVITLKEATISFLKENLLNTKITWDIHRNSKKLPNVRNVRSGDTPQQTLLPHQDVPIALSSTGRISAPKNRNKMCKLQRQWAQSIFYGVSEIPRKTDSNQEAAVHRSSPTYKKSMAPAAQHP